MGEDDLKFAVVLVSSVFMSMLIRIAVPVRFRSDVSAVAGACYIIYACGVPKALHPLSAVGVSMVCHRFVPDRYRVAAAFATAFGHLAVLRMLPTPPGGPTNAALLVLVLRLAAADGAVAASANGEHIYELMRYTLCYHGLFTAPYYTYAEWVSTMRTPSPVPPVRRWASTLLQVLFAIGVWRGTAAFLPYTAVWETPAGEAAFYNRLAYFYLSSFQFRWRFYSCWLTMQLSGEFLGHHNPSNADLNATELCTSPSQYIGGWNSSVQAWLKHNVYRGLLPATSPRLIRQLATFAVSAFWHGVRPGYYLFFLGLFAMVCVEQLVRAALADQHWEGSRLMRVASGVGEGDFVSRAAHALVSLVCHVWTMLCFGFFGGAFNLLAWSDVLNLWRSLRFYGLWLTLLPALPAVLSLLWAARRRTARGQRPRGAVRGVASPIQTGKES